MHVVNKLNTICLKRYLIFILITWTFIVGLSLWWNHGLVKSGALDSAKIEARTAIRKDIVYRRWNAMHGGVYVPITPETAPNPWLVDPLRDLVSENGLLLTKINPSYMTRQVHEIARTTDNMWGHITSLNPIRPGNKADDWEVLALSQFTKGAPEVSSVEIWDGRPFMRLMSPLKTEESCLKCHAVQGYELGDIRGGISVAVPLAPYFDILKPTMFTLFLVHCFAWGLGVFAAFAGVNILEKRIRYRLEREEALGREENIQGRMEMAATVGHELNQPLQIISGNVDLLLMDIAIDTPHGKKLTTIKDQIQRMGDITRKILTITQQESLQYPQGKIIPITKK
ncbi:c-type heme family protein [Desulfocicer niacini]